MIDHVESYILPLLIKAQNRTTSTSVHLSRITTNWRKFILKSEIIKSTKFDVELDAERGIEIDYASTLSTTKTRLLFIAVMAASRKLQGNIF